MPKPLSLDDVIVLIKDAITNYGTQEDAAHALGVAPPRLSEVMNRRRPPGPALLAGLGLEARTIYVRKEG